MRAACLVAGGALAAMVALAGTVAGGGGKGLEELFAHASRETGLGYAQARADLEKAPAVAEEFLRQKIKTSQDGRERWLAEILLACVAHNAELRRLELALQQTIARTIGAYSSPWHSPPLPPSGYVLMLAGEKGIEPVTVSADALSGSAPVLSLSTPKESWLPASDNWNPLLGEILLKGWLPEEPTLLTALQTEKLAYREVVEDDYMAAALDRIAAMPGDPKLGTAGSEVRRWYARGVAEAIRPANLMAACGRPAGSACGSPPPPRSTAADAQLPPGRAYWGVGSWHRPDSRLAFADAAGQIWRWELPAWSESVAEPECRLQKWDAVKHAWETTPVQVGRRPSWPRQRPPDWAAWIRQPRVITGSDGAVLVAMVSDVYTARGRSEKHYPGTAKQRNPPYWFDAWLYRDGRWSEVQPLAEVLRSQREFFIGHFTGQTSRPGFFDLQVAGGDLWWADCEHVHVLDASGKETIWPALQERPGANPNHGTLAVGNWVNLVLLPGGTLWWLVGSNQLSALKRTPGEIQVHPVEVNNSQAMQDAYVDPDIYVARDGRAWIYGNPLFRDKSYLLAHGTWREDEGAFRWEDPEGGIWFALNPVGDSTSGGFEILHGGHRSCLPLPGIQEITGYVTPAGKDLVLVSAGDRILALHRIKQEPGWMIQSILQLRGTEERDHVWLDGHGHLVGAGGWVAHLPAGFP